MTKELLTDDLGFKGDELRLLPVGGGGNVIVSNAGYLREMEYRKKRIRGGASFDLPAWDDLKVYE